MALLDGLTLEVQTTAGGTTVDLGQASSGPPGPLTHLLRPRYTVRQGGAVLLVHEPVGPPEHGVDLRAVLLLAALLVVAFIALR